MASTRPSPAPRRRAPRRGDRTEQAILDTAERLLAQRPLSAIGIDELAKGAGVSRPAFYFYFPSREAVLRVLAERISDELYGAAEVFLRRGGESPSVAIRRALTSLLALWRRHGAVLRAAIHASDGDEEMRRFWSGVGRRFIDATAEQIERERAAGIALPGPPSAQALASVLIAMNDRALHKASLSRSRTSEAEMIDALTVVWLRTIYGDDANA
jgi:AcrR family transcriptional regulator